MTAPPTTSSPGSAAGHRRRTHARLVAAAVAVALLGAACGGDDDAAAPTADTAAAGRSCSPVGEDLAGRASATVDVSLTDYAFGPSTLEVGAGVVTFAAANAGSENHELAFLPGGGDVPLNDEGEPDEDALAAAGAFELEAFGPGQDCRATYDLRPGTYTLFCIVEAPDGETHYDKGMRGQLVVE